MASSLDKQITLNAVELDHAVADRRPYTGEQLHLKMRNELEPRALARGWRQVRAAGIAGQRDAGINTLPSNNRRWVR
jgi:hypothetical protein